MGRSSRSNAGKRGSESGRQPEPPRLENSAFVDGDTRRALRQLGLEGAPDNDCGDWLSLARNSQQTAPLGLVGPYEIVREAGRGGQAIVYEGVHQESRARVAIKRIFPGAVTDVDTLQRLQRERHLLKQLNHPNIVSILDALEADSRPYLVMQWIDGVDIATWNEMKTDGSRSPESESARSLHERVHLFLKICEAVQHAHDRNIIHRDIKPTNILVDAQGEPHLLDFGLARIFDDTHRVLNGRATTNGRFAGTPAYASPEQFYKSGREIDGRTDVYSLGVVLFQLLTGRLPCETDAPIADVVTNVCDRPPLLASRLVPGLPDGVDRILNCALAKHPAQRYATPMALAEDLSNLINNRPLHAAAPSTASLVKALYRRNRVACTLGVMMVVLLAGAVVVTGWLARTAIMARDREHAQRAVAEKTVSFLSGMLAQADPRRRGGAVRVVDVLEDAAQRVESELSDAPLASAEVYDTIGQTFYNLWLTSRSERYFRKALELYRRNLGDEHLLVAACRQRLAAVLSFQDDPEAIDLQKEALRVHRLHHGENHPDVAANLHGLAFAIYRGTRPPNYEEAERMLNAAQEIRRKLFGDDNLRLLGGMHLLAAMRSRQGRSDESIRIYEHALRIMETRLDPDDPALIECLADYSQCLVRAGRFEQALQNVDDVIERTGKQFGAAWLAQPLYVRGFIHLQQDRVTEAESLLLAAMHRYLSRMAEHPDVLLHTTMQPSLDHSTYRQSLESVILPLDAAVHPDPNLFTDILMALSETRLAKGDAVQAHNLASRAVELRHAYTDRENWRTLRSKNVLGNVLVQGAEKLQVEGETTDMLRRKGRRLLNETCDGVTTLYGSASPYAKEMCGRAAAAAQ